MRKVLTLALCGAALVSSPAIAQIAVIDSANLARSIETARNTLETIRQMEQQVREAKRLYDSVNGVTDIQDVVRVLDNQQLHGALPEGVSDTTAYISDDLRDLGALTTRAEQIYNSSNFRTGVLSSQGALEILGRRASRDRALAENDLENTQLRAQGVESLNDRLSTATTQREIDEINARSQIETLGVLNDMARREAAQDLQRAEAARERLEREAQWRRTIEERVANQGEQTSQSMGAAIEGVELDLSWGDGS